MGGLNKNTFKPFPQFGILIRVAARSGVEKEPIGHTRLDSIATFYNASLNDARKI